MDGKLDILLLPMSITTPPFRRIREQAKFYKFISKTADTHSDSECHKKEKESENEHIRTLHTAQKFGTITLFFFVFFYIGYVYLVKYTKIQYNCKILLQLVYI